jgi:hypothetical protein
MASFSEGEWRRLEASVQRLPGLKPGLYRLRVWPKSDDSAGQIPAEQFWQIIEGTKAATREEQLELLKSELQRLSVQEVLGFQRRFSELKAATYNWDLWLVVWLCQGGMCSDDSFADFRNWLISQGRAVYETGLREPDALVDEIRRSGDAGFELFGYVAGQVYRERAGREFPELELPRPEEPAGGEWLRAELKDRTGRKLLNRCVVFQEMGSAEFAAIEQRFPRVWEFCVQNGIIKTGGAEQQQATSRIPTPEEVARALVDPKLAETDFPAYLKALADAARAEYDRRKKEE